MLWKNSWQFMTLRHDSKSLLFYGFDRKIQLEVINSWKRVCVLEGVKLLLFSLLLLLLQIFAYSRRVLSPVTG